jgi:hypothetical protein
VSNFYLYSPLGSKGRWELADTTRLTDRTHPSVWPAASSQPMPAMCPPFKHHTLDLNGQKYFAPELMVDWMRYSKWPDAVSLRVWSTIERFQRGFQAARHVLSRVTGLTGAFGPLCALTRILHLCTSAMTWHTNVVSGRITLPVSDHHLALLLLWTEWPNVSPHPILASSHATEAD